jgi:hypothetical protein
VLAGCDFFLVEVLSWRGLVTYYVLFFLQLACRMNIFAKWDFEGPEVLAIAA